MTAKSQRQKNPNQSVNGIPGERKSGRISKLVIFLIVVLLGSPGTAGYYFSQYQKLKKSSSNPSLVSQAEAEDLVKKVSRLIIVPTTEIPTIATISDYSQLKDQSFFNNSTNGDKLLIYSKAKIVVLYIPTQDKVINIGPLTIDNQSTKPTK